MPLSRPSAYWPSGCLHCKTGSSESRRNIPCGCSRKFSDPSIRFRELHVVGQRLDTTADPAVRDSDWTALILSLLTDPWFDPRARLTSSRSKSTLNNILHRHPGRNHGQDVFLIGHEHVEHVRSWR